MVLGTSVRSFVRFCNALPFAGKYPIRFAAYALWSREAGASRDAAFRRLVTILAFLLWAHAHQTWIGVEAASLPSLPVALRAYGGAYAVGNVLAIVAQVDLLVRARRFRFRGPARGAPKPGFLRSGELPGFCASVIFTGAAQFVASAYLP